MIVKDSYEQIINSPEFIKDQLLFEVFFYQQQSQVFKKIVSECSKQQYLAKDQYASCQKQIKKNIKRYALFTQLLFEKREQLVKQKIRDSCSNKVNDFDRFFECVSDVENKFLALYKNEDQKCLDDVRKNLYKHLQIQSDKNKVI